MDECGVSWEECGENIAGATYEMTPEELVKSWMNSPAHKENILDPIYQKWGWVIVIQAVEQEGTVITGHRIAWIKRICKIERAMPDNPAWLFPRRKLYEKN